MTPRDHNDALAIGHLLYGVVSLLACLAASLGALGFLGLSFALQSFLPGESSGWTVGLWAVRALIVAVPVLVTAVLTLPFLVTGYGLLRGRSWARAPAVVAAALSLAAFPLGTALAVYTLWFFFMDTRTRALYEERLSTAP